jgi:hypothetical protein
VLAAKDAGRGIALRKRVDTTPPSWFPNPLMADSRRQTRFTRRKWSNQIAIALSKADVFRIGSASV